MRYFFITVMVLAFWPLTAVAQEERSDEAVDPALQAFAERIVEIFSSGSAEDYMDIYHPQCPEPLAMRLEYNFDKKWKADTAQIRYKAVEETYDLDQLVFDVPPQASLEFQVWQVPAEGEAPMELVTGFAVAKHEGEYKILDYPCFKPKEN